jgi:hypothetical protein
VPRGWREGDAVLAAITPGELDLAAEAALVAFLWRAAQHCSLVHDGTIAEAATWSGVPAELELPAGAAAILACAPGDVGTLEGMDLVEIGTVG